MNYINSSYTDKKSSQFQILAILSIAFYIVITAVFETSTILNARFSSVSLYICLIVCILDLIKRNVLKVDYYSLCLLALGVVFTLSSFVSPALYSLKYMYLYRYWSTFVLVFLIINVISSIKEVNILLDAIVIAGVALALFMYGQYGFANLMTAVERLDSDMGNQNQIGLYGAYAIIFAFYRMLMCRGSSLKLLYISSVVIVFPSVVFTASRKAIIVIVVALVFMFTYFYESKNILKKIISFALVIGVVYLLITKIPGFSVIKGRFEEMFDLFAEGKSENAGDINRINFIKTSFAEFFESPIIGKGFCYSYYLFGTYSHNNFTELLLNNGLVGFILHYIPKLAIMYCGSQLLKINRQVGALLLVISSSIIVCDIGVITYYNRFLLIVMAIAVKAYVIEKDIYKKNLFRKDYSKE